MPVNWMIAGPDGSFAKVPLQKLAVTIQTTPGAFALRPVIDSIHLTSRAKKAHEMLTDGSLPKQLPPSMYYLMAYWAAIWSKLQLAAQPDKSHPIKRSTRRVLRYRYTFDLHLQNSKSRPLLCLPAKYGNTPPMLLMLNADQLGPAGLIELEQVWNGLVGDLLPFRGLLLDARVSRLDTAIDILNVSLPDLFLHHDKIWKVWAVHHPTSGLQTIQYYLVKQNQKSPFSNPKKRSDLIVYDKRSEQLDHGKDPRYGSLPHTRIERSQNPTTLVRNILSLKPNFDGWTIVRVDGFGGKPQDDWRRFIDSLRSRGIAAAGSLHKGMPTLPVQIDSMGPQDLIVPELLESWDVLGTSKFIQTLATWANLPSEVAMATSDTGLL